MPSEKQIEVALNSLEKARELVKIANYGRAFAHYLVVFELLPNKRRELESDFIHILNEWSLQLEQKGQSENIKKCYFQAQHYFPSNIEILNNFGMQLLRLGENACAKYYFNMVNVIDKNFLSSEKNLLVSKINLLPRWHFRMLNDRIRNEAYFTSLELNISQKFCRVMDIGAGCGLLSLFATKFSGVQSITAVEESPVLYKLANDICIENGINNITLINRNSTTLNGNLCGYHNLLVTEIFDAALFGEHVLETLIHAWDNLLEPSSKVIPYFAKVYVTGINDIDLYKKHRYLGSLFGLNEICLTQHSTEPYGAENLRNCNFVTDTQSFVAVNFNDVTQLKHLYNNNRSILPTLLTASINSEIHGYAVWFDLQLSLEESNTITTNPKKSNVSCWEQAVIYLDHPYKVKKNEQITISLSCVNNILHLNEAENYSGCKNCYKVSQEIIMFLNDETLVEKFQLLAEKEAVSKKNLLILDLSPFPIFGIHMAREGCNVHCLINCCDQDLKFLNYVCEVNNILENVNVLSEEAFSSLFTMDGIYDIIYVDAINSNGTINDKYVSELGNFLRLLKPDGLMLPKEINLYVQLASSDYLENCWRVNDENCLGFKIAEQINDYAVPELWEMDFKATPYTNINEKMKIWNILQIEELMETEIEFVIPNNSKPNTVFYWFEMNFTPDISYTTQTSIYYKRSCFLLSYANTTTDTLQKHIEKDYVKKLLVKQHKGLLKICDSNL